MYKNKSIISIVPARKGSKGIPRKNMKLLAGKPLIVYAIEASLNSKYIDLAIVISNDKEVYDIVSKEYRTVKFVTEPEELATDKVQMEAVMLYTVRNLLKYLKKQPDYILLLEPTSPLRTGVDIDKAIQKIIDENGDSLLSVCENSVFLWTRNGMPLNYQPEKRPRRQDKEWEYVENGAIYITKTSLFLRYKCRLLGKPLFYVMPKDHSWDLDTLHDWDMTEHVIERHRQVGGTDF